MNKKIGFLLIAFVAIILLHDSYQLISRNSWKPVPLPDFAENVVIKQDDKKQTISYEAKNPEALSVQAMELKVSLTTSEKLHKVDWDGRFLSKSKSVYYHSDKSQLWINGQCTAYRLNATTTEVSGKIQVLLEQTKVPCNNYSL
jgi:hypothetical protein